MIPDIFGVPSTKKDGETLLYGMAMCLNLESLDHEILQMKISIFK